MNRRIVLSAFLSLTLTGVPAVAAPAPVRLAQRLLPDRGPIERIATEHFLLRYNPNRLSSESARQAGEQAEQGWKHCAEVFQRELAGPIPLDLTPDFMGATGFAMPGDAASSDPDKRPKIGIRYADLDYLGLSGLYVLTHEIAHVFSGKLAGTALGEGIADWGAGQFSTLPTGAWWGAALQKEGLWIDPEGLFITGDFPSRPEVDETIRTAQYVESALLVRFLIGRFGLEKFSRFAEDYGKARGSLTSNDDRRQGRRTGPPGRVDPRTPPDPAAVRATFEQHFGRTWEQVRADWEREMAADPVPESLAARLVMGQRIYGAIRNYEMWLLAQRPGPEPEVRAQVRELFTRASAALAAGDVEEAGRALARARAAVAQLRRPGIIAYNLAPDAYNTGNLAAGRGVQLAAGPSGAWAGRTSGSERLGTTPGTTRPEKAEA